MALRITKEQLERRWIKGNEPIVYKGKKYRISKMSYGDYFLEPITWKGGEKDGFAPGTLWLEKKIIKNQYGANQIVYELDSTLNE